MQKFWELWELPLDDPVTIVTIIFAIGYIVIFVGLIFALKGSKVSDAVDEKKPKSKSDSKPFKFSGSL